MMMDRIGRPGCRNPDAVLDAAKPAGKKAIAADRRGDARGNALAAKSAIGAPNA